MITTYRIHAIVPAQVFSTGCQPLMLVLAAYAPNFGYSFPQHIEMDGRLLHLGSPVTFHNSANCSLSCCLAARCRKASITAQAFSEALDISRKGGIQLDGLESRGTLMETSLGSSEHLHTSVISSIWGMLLGKLLQIAYISFLRERRSYRGWMCTARL